MQKTNPNSCLINTCKKYTSDKAKNRILMWQSIC